jgi:hypothetical protein
METQHMMEFLLARMDANRKTNQEDLLARMEAKIDAHKEADQEHMQQMMARLDANEERMNASLRDEIQYG